MNTLPSSRFCRSLLAIVLVAGSVTGVSADPILQTYSDSLTTFKYSSSSRVQGVRPLAVQRGVHLDGSLCAGSIFGWAMEGNPYESSCGMSDRFGDVSLVTGGYAPTKVDISLPAQVPWVIGRSYSQVQENATPAHQDSDGYQGTNWFQMSQPELRFYDADGNPATDGDADIIYLIYGADRYIEFERTDDDEDTFQAVNGAAGVIELEAGTPDVYVYYDQRGNRTYFFGGNTASGKADWQFWKLVDPAGNTAYVGHKTSATDAVTDGYNADGSIAVAYDSATNDGRRFTYTYSSIDSVSRLVKVTAESKGGGTWASPTGLAEVQRVAYDYYQTSDNTHGPDGSLKLVTIRRALSDSGSTLSSGIYEERKTYYRYYTQSWSDSDGRRGGIGMLKMVIEPEGTRNFDWGEDGAETPPALDDGFHAASDTSLKAYAAAYFEYASGTDYRVWKAFFNGECGCSGGTNGMHTFTYESNGSFSNTSGYDTAWKTRTILKQPDLICRTHYFDEVGQPLSQIVTDADPSGSPTDIWVTEVVRDSGGRVTAKYTPAANASYTHSTGTYTRNSGAGLVRLYERKSSGDLLGYVEGMLFKEGDTGTAYYESWQDYSTRSLEVATGVAVVQPVIDEMRRYHTAGASAGTTANYDATTVSHLWWSGTSTNVEYLALKSVTTTAPTVTTANNGSNAATTTSRHLLKDGRIAHTVDARGVVSLTTYENGQPVSRTSDLYFTNAQEYPYGEEPEDYDIPTTPATAFNTTTTSDYDAVGRSTSTLLADGREMRMYYSRLADGRLATISIPRVEDDSGVVFFGPASYTVTNLAGRAVFSGVIAIDNDTGTTAALASWLDEGEADPITALLEGELARMSTSIYNQSSGQLLESRTYFDIPASGVGTEGTHYDATRYGYDDMGRTVRVLQPHGTISRTAYDDLGRTFRQYTGTNDSSFAGGSSSGTDNMVKVSELVYDGGNDGGNSHLTKRIAYVEDSDTDKRETSFLYDVRGRAVVTINPQAPHTLVKHDNLGRVIEVGQYSSSSGLDIGDTPTSTDTNRMALSVTTYDEKGQAWKQTRHKIDPADGSSDDTLESLSWFDPDGRVIKSVGEQITKTFYDRLGRSTHSFVLASVNDTTYAHAADVAGDIVLEERQTVYESGDSSDVVMTAVIQRLHDDYGGSETTGPLDTNADTNPFKYTAADLKGRIQIAAMWYDDLDRPIEMVQYGTYNGSDFDRKPSGTFLTIPARSATALRTSTMYNDDGTVDRVVDPRGIVASTLYDDLGRQVTTIQNYVDGTPSGPTGDDDLYTRYVYTDGLMTRMWVDIDGDNVVDAADQVTDYIFGTVKGTPAQSKVASGHMLRAAKYPDSTNTGTDHLDINSDSDDLESFAYNAQGQQTLRKDQSGNVLEMDYDTSGRLLHRRVTTLAGGFDGAVRRISMGYDGLGRTRTVTQHDNAAPGSGNVVDEVRHTYEGWGMLELIEQDRNSAVGAGGSVDDYETGFTYAKRAGGGSGGRNTIMRTETTYPDGVVVGLVAIDNVFSNGDDFEQGRVFRMKVGSTTVAEYDYLGVGTLVGTRHFQPDSFSNRFGSTSGVYPELDRFNRPVAWTWTKDLSTDVNFYDVTIAYDENSNITRVEDNVHTAGAAGSGNGLYDALYTMDNLNRLLRAKEGHWDGSTVTDGNAKRDEVWTLDQTGNWELFKRDLDGDLNYTDALELKDRRTHNVVNELLTRDIDDNSSVNFTLVYDDNGNLTDDGEHYTYEYDAFGRLRKVKNRSTTALVSEYRYNGLGHRIGWHYDVDADGTVESNTDDPWFMFVYDDRWRIVNTYRLEEWAYDAGNPSGSEAKERFVYHQAGLGGRGGSSYIDSVMLRDRDANTAWNDASDGTMEERIYYAQNWRHDVSALITDDGRMIEWVKYSSYGVPMSLPAGDTDSDGDFDSTDASAITGTYDVRKDVNLDGTVDIVDYLDALDINGGLSTQGWSILSNPKWNNRKGYAGYEGDTVLAGTKWHVRHRVLDSELGRWMRRDPLGYVDGRSVYAASRNGGIGYIDPLGLANMKPCPMGGGCGGGTHPVPPPTPTPPGQSPPIVDIPEPGIHECYAKVGLCMAVSPIVRDLMSRLDQCSSSSGGAYTSPKIKCSSDGLGGLYNCGNGGDNEIIITHPITPGTGLSLVATCETLSHELSHALSHCESGLCLQDMDLDEHACWYWACDEAIATSRSGSCCPGGSEYMLYDDYCACIRASVMASMSGSQCTIDQIDWALGFSSCMNTAHSPCPAEASICMANR